MSDYGEVETFRGLTRFFESQGVRVTGNQLYMWHRRRKVNGFPEHVACVFKPVGGGPRRAPMFVTLEVYAWWTCYDVQAQYRRGAAPKGNGYAEGRHGPRIGVVV